METLNDRTARSGTSGLGALRSAALALALAAGACTALGQSRQPAAGGQQGTVDRSGQIVIDDNMTVELHVRNEDLANVLQMLSLQSQKSIIAGPNVNANVTANLYGVTFYEALDAVLHTYGYAYVEQGNMIYVMTRDEADKIVQANRLPVSKVIRLNYLSAVDAAEYVSPLLSNMGEIRTNGRTQDFVFNASTPVGSDTYAGGAMMIVFDYEDHVAEIEALLMQIDTRPEQVLVEATILQASLREDNAFGVDFSIIGDLDFSEFIGGPLNAVNSMISGASTPGGGGAPVPADGEGRALVSNVGQTSQPGGLKIGIIDNDVAVFMRFLDEVTDTTIISNPKVVTLNRQVGHVQVGRRVGYLQTTTTDTSTQQSVEFLNTGTQLSFRPWITADRMIRMELRPKVSRPFLRTVTNTDGNPITIPDEDTSEIVTNVVTRDGQTIVLGGLFTESTQAGRRQVPILGSIPFFGIPFRGHNDTVERAEVIFMIKPTIMSDDVLIDQGRRGMQYVDRVRMGAREGLLPWSRERQAGQLIVEAERLAAEGNMDRALFCVRRALAIQPMQPDAIRLRERLLSEPTVWPSRSMLEDIVNREVDNRIRTARQQALAEFTSLVRPDNRWNDLDNIPAATFTGVNVDSPALDMNRWDGGRGSVNDYNPNDLPEFPSFDPPVIPGESFENPSLRGSSAAPAQPAPGSTGQAAASSPSNNHSWTRALSSEAPQAGSTARPETTRNNAQARNMQPTPSSASSPAASQQASGGPVMYPFAQAQPAAAAPLASVEPDADGFYPLFPAGTTAQNLPGNASPETTSAIPVESIHGRIAWIFGVKGRQMTTPAQNQQGALVNVQESATSGNP